MAQLAKTSAPGNWGYDGDDWWENQQSQFKQLEAESAKVDPSVSLVGALVSFPCADSAAYYRVCKDKPLTLQHIPYCDAWQVPYSQIRGLRRSDIVREIEGAKRMRAMFG